MEQAAVFFRRPPLLLRKKCRLILPGRISWNGDIAMISLTRESIQESQLQLDVQRDWVQHCDKWAITHSF
jgi:hypothetical protein